MRPPRWLYRRPPRGWADVERELETTGVPRVGAETERPKTPQRESRELERRVARIGGDAAAEAWVST